MGGAEADTRADVTEREGHEGLCEPLHAVPVHRIPQSVDQTHVAILGNGNALLTPRLCQLGEDLL